MRPVLLLTLILLAACGTARSSRRAKPETIAPPEAWAGVGRVAVLPPDNWTATIGPEYVAWNRAVVAALLREKGYAVTPLVEVNRFLLRNRFTQAGEVRLYSLAELGKELAADAILFWDITGDGLNVDLLKTDGTRLWGSGEVYLDLPYNAPLRGSVDDRMALSLHEILRKLPGRS